MTTHSANIDTAPADAAVTVAMPPDAIAPPEPQPETPVVAPPAPSKKHWYVVKVQSGREETIKDAIERRVKIEGLEEFFGQVVVPIERETVTIQTGKRKGQKTVKKKKKFPGYVMAEVEYNDKILYLFRETSGVGDFVGGTLTRAPTPMSTAPIFSIQLGSCSARNSAATTNAPPCTGTPHPVPDSAIRG